VSRSATTLGGFALLAVLTAAGCASDDPKPSRAEGNRSSSASATATADGRDDDDATCVGSSTTAEAPYGATAAVEVRNDGEDSADYALTAVFTRTDNNEVLGELTGNVAVDAGATKGIDLKGFLNAGYPKRPDGNYADEQVSCMIKVVRTPR
jgi:hypothetical protein